MGRAVMLGRPRGRLATPMRTPRVGGAGGAGGDRIMMEAQNLARLQAGQTPLAGGENPELFASDFSGVAPRAFAAATPNPLAGALTPGATGRPGATPALGGSTPGFGGATPGGRAIAGARPSLLRRCLFQPRADAWHLPWGWPRRGTASRPATATPGVQIGTALFISLASDARARRAGVAMATPGASVGGTPLRGASLGPGATPGRTPVRDALGLNDPDAAAPAEASRREARAREERLRSDLRAGLAGLPEPQHEYVIEAPQACPRSPSSAPRGAWPVCRHRQSVRRPGWGRPSRSGIASVVRGRRMLRWHP